jgi:hypothetical protein
MRTAAALREAGFRPRQSDYYQDIESREWREIDVTGEKTWENRETGSCRVRIMFIAECKASRDKPWLLFTSPKSSIAGPARIVQRVSTRLGHAWLGSMCQRQDIQDLSLFSVAEAPAYGITQAFSSGVDVTYAAAIGVVKAAIAYAHGTKFGNRFTEEWAVIIFPIIVTEARLFSCSYDEAAEGRIKIQEVKSGDLLWRNPLSERPHTIIKILTANYMDEYFQEAARSAARLVKETHSELHQATQRIKALSKSKTAEEKSPGS